MQVYHILIWCVGLAAFPGYCILSEPPPETPAEAITKDVAELSEQLDEVAEEGESEEANLDPKAAHEKQQEKFEKLYHNALESGLEEAKKEYKAFEHGAVEGLDLVGLASEHLKQFWYIGQCRRNYSLPCPNQWSWDESEKVCTAPADYDGPCEKRKSFDNMDSKAREDYAWRCHASWPCVNDTPIDNTMLCPLEWTKIASTVCIAPTVGAFNAV
ncbi:cpw-wpc domain-containing protein, putative [Babesia ovata]|uniref:Cpw-wpc domain-containing protein, putative n=1 Tax=Babesia ovata TaxID=189622 RepID=A0A2H6K6L3_9APIC|nr:cpw-wpc domain-containing protein, putative [Babesia ovata]GBE58618.1 cpw-wpc domain-containing protein, putative [Babesia ovata]